MYETKYLILKSKRKMYFFVEKKEFIAKIKLEIFKIKIC